MKTKNQIEEKIREIDNRIDKLIDRKFKPGVNIESINNSIEHQKVKRKALYWILDDECRYGDI